MTPERHLLESFVSSWMSMAMTMLVFSTLVASAALLLTRIVPAWRNGRASEIVLIAGTLSFMIPPGAFRFLAGESPAPVYRLSHVEGLPFLAIAFVLIHLTGTLLSVGWLMLQHFRVEAIRRTSLPVTSGQLAEDFSTIVHALEAPGKTALAVSHRIRVPCAAGVFRPLVMLPARLASDMSRDEMRSVLIHEITHVKRRDVLVEWLSRLVSALWWFHPVPRFLAGKLRVVREELCDDAVVLHDRGAVGSYAEALYRVASLASLAPPQHGIVGMAENLESLTHRIRRLGNSTPPDPGRRSLVVATITIAVAIIASATVAPSLDVDPRELDALSAASTPTFESHRLSHQHHHNH